MFKVLHFSLHKKIPSGVIHQLLSEQKSQKLLPDCIQWDTIVFSHDDKMAEIHKPVPMILTENSILGLALNYISLRTKAYKWLRQHANQYDAIVLRYRAGDLFLLKESRWFGNVFTLHHTKELEEAKTRYGQGGRFEEYLERYVGLRVLQKAKGIIGVTKDIASYELARISESKPSYCYPNGINMEDVQVVGDKRSGTPTLIFVASMYTQWHGLDLVLREFQKANRDFRLHVVGFEKIDEPIEDDRIIFHGSQDRDYIINLMAECDLGLGSFALNRIGLLEACHLKVREYLAAGVPVYAAYRDAGLPDDFPFYKVGQISVDRIIEYALKARRYSRMDIRQASEQYIDKTILMNKLVNWLESIMNRQLANNT